MRFGLDRMRRLMTALGRPQEQFDSIHVVGTNGKSSTTRMIAAILERHGLRTGTYLSPHLVLVRRAHPGGRARPRARRLRRRRRARRARRPSSVDRSLPEDDHVTQFEALTAAAYSELARREVEVAVIEAGLGGRYDATNVIPRRSRCSPLSVSSTRAGWGRRSPTSPARSSMWSGPAARSRSGLASIRTRVAVARRVGERAGRANRRAPADPGVSLAALGAFQRRNFALARSGGRGFLESWTRARWRGPRRRFACRVACRWSASSH